MWTLKQNGSVIESFDAWSPREFSRVIKGISFPRNVPENFSWQNSEWEISFIPVVPIPPTEEELAQQAKIIAQRQEQATLKNEAFTKNFVNMTLAEVGTYIDNEVTNLAGAQRVLKQMARMLLILARQGVSNGVD